MRLKTGTGFRKRKAGGSRILKQIHADNISTMFTSISVAMIFASLTGVVAVLIDGIVSSRFLGSDVYSGIALMRPFSSVVLVLAGFFSAGCSLVCSHLIGIGEKEKANEAFNLTSALAVLVAALLILAIKIRPETALRLSGVFKARYPGLTPHMYGYLSGYMFGLPAILLVQVMGPVIVMDNGKKLFSVSSAVLCIVDIAGDLLNAFVFHGGAFGMGMVTSLGYILQLLLLFLHFRKPNCFFRLSPKLIRFSQLREIVHCGMPAFVKRGASALKDILINYINLMAALSTAAIAARGIQTDLFTFLFCISSGLGHTLVTMAGAHYSSDDLQGLKRLYSYAMKFGIQVSVVCAAIVFVFARPLSQIYTNDAEVLALAVFSIRWMALGLVFDTISVLVQHYLQGIKKLKLLNVLCIAERLVIPVACAFVFGLFFGSKGILAATGISKFVMILVLFVYICIRCKGIPKKWEDVMFLPEGFGGSEADNMYAVISTPEDAVRESENAYNFCIEQGADERKAYYVSLCVEEMTVNILDHAKKAEIGKVETDFRLYVSDDGRICVSLRDLSDQFDPTAFFDLHRDDEPGAHIGIRMVTKMATDIKYYSAFDSNNLIIYID